MRLVAHAVVTGIPDLTEHSRTILTAWRDRGVEPYGVRVGDTSYSDVIDQSVRAFVRRGMEWEADLPADVLRGA